MNNRSYKDSTSQKAPAAGKASTKNVHRASLSTGHQNCPVTAKLNQFQAMADRSVQLDAMTQLQTLGNEYTASHGIEQRRTIPTGTPRAPSITSGVPVQRSVDVFAKERDGSVEITADGPARNFSNGDAARNVGWNGVDKYKATARIGRNRNIEIGEINNDYTVAQAGHVLGQQNGGLGSDSDNIFAQDGGTNNSPYRTDFENPMRTQLNAADPYDRVRFRAVLYGYLDDDGDRITPWNGVLDRGEDEMDRSEEETDFDDFSDDSMSEESSDSGD